MTERAFADRVAAVAALEDPVRRSLYDFVAASEDAVGRDAAAAGLDLPRSTAAFHLDRLAAAGLLTVEFRRLGSRTGPGAGRPAKLYRRSDEDLEVSVPERRYDVVGEVFAAAVTESARSGRSVDTLLPEAASEIGRHIGDAAESLRAALDRYGFEPVPDGRDGLVLRNCPFHRLAREYTELVCGMNLALLQGIAAGTGESTQTAIELDPAPGRCCVRVRSASTQPS